MKESPSSPKKDSAEAASMDDQFTGAFPRYSGAISEITDGPPEDINEMPATRNSERDGSIYDGSHLMENLENRSRQK